jgi:hypothetical protein
MDEITTVNCMTRKSTIRSSRFYPEPEKAMKFNF